MSIIQICVIETENVYFFHTVARLMGHIIQILTAGWGNSAIYCLRFSYIAQGRRQYMKTSGNKFHHRLKTAV